jgi:hypothetical protein
MILKENALKEGSWQLLSLYVSAVIDEGLERFTWDLTAGH